MFERNIRIWIKVRNMILIKNNSAAIKELQP